MAGGDDRFDDDEGRLDRVIFDVARGSGRDVGQLGNLIRLTDTD